LCDANSVPDVMLKTLHECASHELGAFNISNCFLVAPHLRPTDNDKAISKKSDSDVSEPNVTEPRIAYLLNLIGCLLLIGWGGYLLFGRRHGSPSIYDDAADIGGALLLAIGLFCGLFGPIWIW